MSEGKTKKSASIAQGLTQLCAAFPIFIHVKQVIPNVAQNTRLYLG